jgi:hypothetical protein
MTAWFKNVIPHIDIRNGLLDESVFAANLGEVAMGTGREIYTNPEMFFQKTYFTTGLKNIAKRVIKGLNGGQDAENRVVSLQTGFGGGKTHTLISLYHLAKWGNSSKKSQYIKNLLTEIGTPNFETAKIAVFTNNTNDAAQGRKVDDLTIRTIWGELAYQLGGKKTYELIKENDQKLIAPKGLFKKVLEQCKPALILVDELADYCISASAVKVEASNLSDQTISFMQELTEAISGTDNCVLIATLPASSQELAASSIAEQILTALENRLSRVGSNVKPVEDDEIFEVIRCRLFENLGNSSEIEKVTASYSYMYQSLFSEIPIYATKSEYREKLLKSYPFHPELIDMFRLRWASHPHFQRTRGVLRILAAIVSDLWKRQTSLAGNHSLIHTSDVCFSNLDALAGQITTLYGPNWDSVIDSDVSGTSSNAFRIDNEVKTLGANNITQGIAATILLGTFGVQGHNKGISLSELKLCMIKPDSFNHNEINGALDRLENNAHYLYYSSSGEKQYWFHTKPNINILINQIKNDIKPVDIEAEILKRISAQTAKSQINVLVNPSEDIPEQLKPTLIILKPKNLVNSHVSSIAKNIIEKIATKKGNGERIYRNTMLFLACSEHGYTKLQTDIKDYLACQKINSDYGSQLEKDQKDDIKKKIDDSLKQSDTSIAIAYSVVLKHSAKNGIEKIALKQFKDDLGSQINTYLMDLLKSEEWLLDSIGLATLRSHGLFPSIENPVKAKDILEAFLRFDDKPMISSADAVSNSLLRYCSNGDFCIASGDGKSFSNYWLKETVPFFDVNDVSYWLVDKSLKQQIQTSSISTSNDALINIVDSLSNGHIDENDIQSMNSNVVQAKEFKSVTIYGRVPFENYTQIYQSFLVPFVSNKIDVEIEFKIKGKSTKTKMLTEVSQEYKIVKESAKQLGLSFEEE